MAIWTWGLSVIFWFTLLNLENIHHNNALYTVLHFCILHFCRFWSQQWAVHSGGKRYDPLQYPVRVPSLCSSWTTGPQTVRTWSGHLEHVSYVQWLGYLYAWYMYTRCNCKCQPSLFHTEEWTCMPCWLVACPTLWSPSTSQHCTPRC